MPETIRPGPGFPDMLDIEMRSTLYVISAGLLWGLISLFIRPLSAAGFSTFQICFLRTFFSAVILVIFVFFKDRTLLKIQLKDLWMFIGTGVISVFFFNYCYFHTIVEVGASTAVVLLYTSPIFIMCISAVLFRERITAIKLVALAMTFAGCIFVAGLAGSGTRLTPIAFLTGIGAGLFYALYSIFGRFALKKYDSVTITVWTFITSSAAGVIVGNVPGSAAIIKAQPQNLLILIGLSVISTVLPYFLYTLGLKNMETGKAGILVAVEPAVGSLLGILAYHESADPLKIIGIILVISAILVMNISFSSAR